MHRPAVSTMTTQRIDRLLRSLVGVADVRVSWRAHTLRTVHILRDSATQPHQLIRNVVSGLQAGFGIQVLPTQVQIHDDPAVFDALEIAADVLGGSDAHESAASPDATAPASDEHANGAHTNGTHSNGTHANGTHANGTHANGRGAAKPATNGAPRNGKTSASSDRAADAKGPAGRRAAAPVEPLTSDLTARPSSASADVIAAAAELVARRQHAESNEGLTLERIDVERRNGTLRCRTVLSLGERQYSAIAEIPDSPSAEAELAARVAVDALRAGGLTTAMLDGVGFITIGKTNYCVASVREPGSVHPRASAAPLIDSMAASATAAVLTALGSFTDARAQNRARAGH